MLSPKHQVPKQAIFYGFYLCLYKLRGINICPQLSTDNQATNMIPTKLLILTCLCLTALDFTQPSTAEDLCCSPDWTEIEGRCYQRVPGRVRMNKPRSEIKVRAYSRVFAARSVKYPSCRKKSAKYARKRVLQFSTTMETRLYR